VYGRARRATASGNVHNNSAGVAGVNRGTGPGIYGENTSGGYAGDFYGDVIVGGNITYSGSLNHSSDARFKEDVAPIPDALESVLRLRGVTFDWRRDDFPEKRFPAGKAIGFIAQEVESVIPSIVSTDSDGYKGVDYTALTPVLVEAIKAQQQRIDAQQERADAQQKWIDAQQKRIDDLTRRLESLENAGTRGMP
jgi:hypothetical protein